MQNGGKCLTILIDITGTILFHGKLVDGAIEGLRHLRESGIPINALTKPETIRLFVKNHYKHHKGKFDEPDEQA
ncbi:hypothetical protein BC936DRAFT_138874 [Jimgerdemannia flammicorona]|uniref:STAS domain-containing protein n=1 Tax=Jimgerdemannia flammicorona TaxID=994334 RepID=A0A433DI87_9FUNG|nr:hypothetical protein BC936DRAFT_138874 [Jimgerdemannia flammicorona]